MATVGEHISFGQGILGVVVADNLLFRKHFHRKLLTAVYFLDEVDFSEATFAQNRYWYKVRGVYELLKITVFWTVLINNFDSLCPIKIKTVLLVVKHRILVEHLTFGNVFNVNVDDLHAAVVIFLVFLFLTKLYILLVRPVREVMHHTRRVLLQLLLLLLFLSLLPLFVGLAITKHVREISDLSNTVQAAFNDILDALNVDFFTCDLNILIALFSFNFGALLI
jgi:hypothetical protein